MKLHTTEDNELRITILEGLKKNDWYCPCVIESCNKPEYRCPCQEFRKQIQVGQTYHCGLYIKDEM